MRWARGFVLSTAALIALYGLVVSAVGLPGRRVEATPPGEPAAEPTLVFAGPTPQALVFVVVAALLIAGVVRQRPGVAWSAWGALSAFAVLSGFSIGLPVLPLALVLLAGLVPLSVGWRRAGTHQRVRP